MKKVSGYSAYVPDLPGCISAGGTKEENKANIAKAINLHIEVMAMEGLPIPPPTTESEMLILS